MRLFKKIYYFSTILLSLVLFWSIGFTDTFASEIEGKDVHYKDNNFALSSYEVILFPGETYQIITADIGELSYSSDFPEIVSVSASGLITANTVGEACVTVSSAKFGTKECKVYVVENDGSYIDTITDYRFPLTTENKTYHYDSFDLYVDKGMYVPPNFPERISEIMQAIEQVTGMSFYPNEESERIYFEAINGWYIEPYAAGSTVTLDDLCIGTGDTTEETYAIAHELLHIIQQRNTGNAGALLTEGFAETYTDDVLSFMDVTPFATEEIRMSYHSIVDSNGIAHSPEEVNCSNVEDWFLHSADMHATSYYLVRYIKETYGDEKLLSMLEYIDENNLGEDIDAVYEYIKSVTSADFIYEFCYWFNLLDHSMPAVDLTEYNSIEAKYMSYQSETIGASYSSKVKYKDNLTIDYTKAISYAQQIIGKKYVGMNIELEGNSNVTFYDVNNNVILSRSQTGRKFYFVPGAVSVKLSTEGTETVFVCNFGFFSYKNIHGDKDHINCLDTTPEDEMQEDTKKEDETSGDTTSDTTPSTDKQGENFASNAGNTFTKDETGAVRCYDKATGKPVINDFKCDGTYTYYFQADGTAMRDRLTYHPDGVHVIYFDSNGHEVFSNFANVKKTIAGETVDDYCFFDVHGYLYVDVVTYDQTGKELYYANPYGVLERGNWFQFSESVKCADGTPWNGAAGNYGYANADGTLMVNQYTYDWEGRYCYLQGNGAAKYD